MAKRANYGFVKRQKELKRQERKEQKAEKKRLKQESTDGGDRRDDLETAASDLGRNDAP